MTGRIPRGMRGLKSFFGVAFATNYLGRIPRGMRGLKFHAVNSL